MKKFSLFLFILLLASGCSVIRSDKSQVISDYSSSNFFIESAYTSFYNDSLRISVDLYAEFIPSSNNNAIARAVFKTNKKLINKNLGLKISPENFVFQVASKHRDLITSLYLLPVDSNIEDTVTYFQHKTRQYALFSIKGKRSSYIQVFSVPSSNFGRLFTEEIFRDECSSNMKKFCYNNYYKAAKWHNRGMSINLYDSEYLENPCDKQVFADTTNFTFPKEKIIGIADNRSNYSVQFKLSNGVANLLENNTVYVNIYDRDSLIIHGISCSPIMTQKVLSPSFNLKIDVSDNDYVMTLTNEKGHIFALLGLFIW